MEWVRYKRRERRVILRTLSDFLSEIVRDASEATLYCGGYSQLESHPRSGKGKPKEREEFLNAHCASESDARREVEGKKPCKICSRSDYRIRNCPDFRKLNLAMRWEAVRKWSLCKTCLNDHGDSPCKLSFRCNVGSCSESHNPLLHPEKFYANCNVHRFQQQSVIFRMIPVTLYNGLYALKAKGVVQSLRVTWTAGVSRLEKDSQRLDLSISARDSTQRFQIKNAHTVEELKLPKQTLGFEEIANRFKHLHDIPIMDYKQGVPRILIGLKDLHLYAPLETRVGRPDEPIAVKSKLGWTVYGPVRSDDPKEDFVGHHSCSSASNQELHDILKKYYALEEAGVSVALITESAAERRAREILDSTTVRIGNRFETGLLWKLDQPTFPDSYSMALRRMKGLEKRLLRDEGLFNNVRSTIAEYLTKGYAHKATFQELQEHKAPNVWYLPLNIVINPRKPDKLRLVWDAAAAVGGVSLNSQLLTGPDMLTSLPSVICRFREREVGFGGDIKEMYHQIRIRKEDQQVQRFLFRNDPCSHPEVYVMDVATFSSTCSPCSAQFIKNKNAGEFSTQYPEASKAIVDNHYVDDYFDSTDTVGEAIRRAKEVRYIHSRGGFEIKNWVASSSEVLQALGEAKPEQRIHFNEDKHTGTERVLGIVWNSESDEFCFTTRLRNELMPFITGEQWPTKRAVLSCVMSFFDPLGLMAPFTIYGKMLIQDLWRTGCEWDEEIDEESIAKWKNWIGRLPEIEQIRIPRYHFVKGQEADYSTLQLHVFVDASSNAYGCAAYFRILVAGKPYCSLVMAKSKVAPLKQLTIPRLELQGGSRLLNTIIETHSLPIKQRYLWTDSRTVLSWIHSDQRKYKQYVTFRIGEIHSLTNPDEWRWLPTKHNVVDDVTKWQAGRRFESDSPWFQGTSFLNHFEELWPQQPQVDPNLLEEIRAINMFHDVSVMEAVIDPLRFSKLRF
ncbi:uncharacterized protein LOC131687749 [Topomyia yanbarensis]|uniref:uncharacterized protein LOC131687749 n=1 Tax=Topomyia yanbarensis TaxID=2498891 RepID=UPI00273AB6C2|nr:uncharacterized protein LOC131687749 [Topomyia yanbarensis]